MKFRIRKKGNKFVIQEWTTFLFWSWWYTWRGEFGPNTFSSEKEAQMAIDEYIDEVSPVADIVKTIEK